MLKKNLTETVLSAEAEHEEEGSYADSYGDDEYEQYEEYGEEETMMCDWRDFCRLCFLFVC